MRDYLEWLEWSKPTRGRKRDTSPARLAEVEAQIADATSPLQRLQLVQLRHDLESASQDEDDPAEGERLRKQFVRVAKAYSKAKGISYGAWREIGVGADALREAGISRTLKFSRHTRPISALSSSSRNRRGYSGRALAA